MPAGLHGHETLDLGRTVPCERHAPLETGTDGIRRVHAVLFLKDGLQDVHRRISKALWRFLVHTQRPVAPEAQGNPLMEQASAVFAGADIQLMPAILQDEVEISPVVDAFLHHDGTARFSDGARRLRRPRGHPTEAECLPRRPWRRVGNLEVHELMLVKKVQQPRARDGVHIVEQTLLR